MGLKDRIDGTALRLVPGHAEGEVVSEASSIHRLKRKLLEEVDLAEIVKLSPSQRRARLENVVAGLLSREGPVLTSQARTALIRQIVDESLGLGVLEPLLADKSVTEIMVNGPDDVWVERNGQIRRVDARFAGEAELLQTIDRIVSAVNRRVDESSPMVDARLPTGERVNVIIPPLALKGASLTIRRFPRAFTFAQLVDGGTIDRVSADLLKAMVRARLSIVVSGGTGSGKTTLLNALSGFIGESERVVTIEDSAELQLQQPHVVGLEARPANVEGKGQVTIRDLVRNSLRMRPDRIVVGEVRGAETLDMLQAMNTGHDGSLTTVHANSPDDAITRLQTLASMSDVSVPFEALRDQINSAVDVIVQIERNPGGARRIREIAGVASRRRDTFRLQTIMAYDRPLDGQPSDDTNFVHFPLPETILHRMAAEEQVVPPAFRPGQADVAAAPEREAE